MTIASYTDLQTAALDWMGDRSAQSAQAPDWIALAEARLNALLGPLEQDATLTGTIGSRELDTSSLSLVEPVALFFTLSSGLNERTLQPQSISRLPFAATNGIPTMWGYDEAAEAIKLDRPCDVAYSFRFRHRGKLALATTSPNWLLTNRPDVYLAATMMWGAGYNQDIQQAAVWKAILNEGVEEVRHTLAKGRKGTLRVDAALVAGGGRYNVFTDD